MADEVQAVQMSREEAATVRWALRYVAQNLSHTHLWKLMEDESLTETEFGERAERLLGVAQKVEETFNLDAFE